ncbi:N-acetylglucosaminyl-diphospho-decaprenol L-rhamnosyltransferase [Cryobacterium sp. CAN_C3]|uniref:glycosyltransferase family 2 protein n=1 Tax=unclassified Cryobacterium TaxID=2649013 RepID=UPI001A2444B6|nr:N-acetylglucosaminyl-diphospho-decaprenol L-rhamnosyltransferase [Cryobacterium sp. CAN_C3]
MMVERMAISLDSVPDASRVAVVTVSYGSEDVLEPFLSSLQKASSQPLCVVVADNKPTGAGGEIARIASTTGASYLPLPANRGYGGAINAAVRELPANIEWLVVSNPDVVMNLGAIDILVQSAGHDLSIGAIGPRILSSNGETYPSARTIPSLRSGIGHALFSNSWPQNPWSRQYRRDSNAPVTRRDAGWLSGACLLIRRSVFTQLGGFDESYFMYFEDVDLGYRIGQLGLRNVYEPAAVVVHTGAHATDVDSALMLQAHHESASRFLSRKYSGRLLWPVRALLAVGLTARARIATHRNPS